MRNVQQGGRWFAQRMQEQRTLWNVWMRFDDRV